MASRLSFSFSSSYRWTGFASLKICFSESLIVSKLDSIVTSVYFLTSSFVINPAFSSYSSTFSSSIFYSSSNSKVCFSTAISSSYFEAILKAKSVLTFVFSLIFFICSILSYLFWISLAKSSIQCWLTSSRAFDNISLARIRPWKENF